MSSRNRNNNNRPTKRQKKSITDDLICPITLELMLDPVMAEDGRIYERSAIEKHIKNNPEELKSPVTNEPMGRRLVSSAQTKSLIETLIESHVITGDIADNWKTRVAEQKELQELIKSAEASNLNSMYELGGTYAFGKRGVKQDDKLAYHWYKKGADERHVQSMAFAGCRLLHGISVEKNVPQGFLLMTSAAEQGSDIAASDLGYAYQVGLFGLPVDKKQAVYWCKKAINPSSIYKVLTDECIANIRQCLQELEEAE